MCQQPDNSDVGANGDERITMEEEAAAPKDRLTRKWASLVAHHPCWIFNGCWCFLMIVSVIGGSLVVPAEQGNNDWVIHSSYVVENFDALEAAIAETDSAKEAEVTPRSEAFFLQSLNIIYENADGGEEDVLSPTKLQQMCQFEAIFVGQEQYKDFCTLSSEGGCEQIMSSIVTVFYTDVYFVGADMPWTDGFSIAVDYKCPLLDTDLVDAKKLVIEQMLEEEGGRIKFGTFLADDAIEKGHSLRSKSILPLGGPLDGYDSLNDRMLEQQVEYGNFWTDLEVDLFDYFDKAHSQFVSGYRTRMERDDLNYLFFAQGLWQKEFVNMQGGDLPIMGLSMLFVFLWITMHCNSILIGLVGQFQILLSVGATIFTYTVVAQIHYFSIMNILCVFLVLGIGADDIFVYVDAWKQSAAEVRGGGTATEIMEQRCLYALSRTRSAVFNTSFTTALAFFVTAITPIMPIKAFGIYAGIAIIFNYLESLTLLPAFVVIWTRGGFEGLSWSAGATHLLSGACYTSGCCSKAPAPAPAPAQKTEAEAEGKGVLDHPPTDMMSQLIIRLYVPLLKTSWFPALVACAMLAVAIQGGVFAAQLTPPKEQETFLPHDHVIHQFLRYPRDAWLGAADDDLITVRFVYGLEGINRDGYNEWLPNESRGTAEYSSQLDLSSAGARAAFKSTCDFLEHHPCTLDSCKGSGFETFVKPGAVQCWVRDFEVWYDTSYDPANATPVAQQDLSAAAFHNALITYRALDTSLPNLIGVVDKTLRFAAIELVTTLPVSATYPKFLDDWFKLANEIVDESNREPHKQLGELMMCGSVYLNFYPTQLALVAGLFRGLAICFPVVLLVLLMATNNIIVGVISTLSIACIVACAMGFFKSALGYDLGIGASVAGVMVIGFSVDYVVHIAHMYTEAGHKGLVSRMDRVHYAVSKIGTTVFAGAVTTAGAGLFMMGCQLTFFVQFAQMLSVTVFFSLLFSMGALTCVLALVGPQGEVGNLRRLKKPTTYDATAVSTPVTPL